MPWGVKDQTSQNFVQHLNLRHKFEYETFVVSQDVCVCSVKPRNKGTISSLQKLYAVTLIFVVESVYSTIISKSRYFHGGCIYYCCSLVFSVSTSCTLLVPWAVNIVKLARSIIIHDPDQTLNNSATEEDL